MTDLKDFQEIGHTGGKFQIEVKTDADGRRGISFGSTHSRPTAASMVGVYALPEGIPVGMIQMGGIGQAFNPPPFPNCWIVFVASDNRGKFGHECPRCKGYWRADGPPARWPMTCPYCGVRGPGHNFLTKGQRKYIEACCEMINDALASDQDGKREIDMDEVADAVGKEVEKPKFYYAEESQQKRFNCRACGGFNDILGRYGYCSSCGTHNGLDELKADIDRIRKKAAPGEYEACVKEGVGAFDSFARQLSQRLAAEIPMTPARRKDLETRKYHNLKPRAESLSAVFDISLFDGMKAAEVEFIIRMFHRRHLYEHNGGEVDEKYLKDSGDTLL